MLSDTCKLVYQVFRIALVVKSSCHHHLNCLMGKAY